MIRKTVGLGLMNKAYTSCNGFRCFWLTCVNKVSLCNDPPSSVRPSIRPSVTNFSIGNISDTIHSRVMKVGQRVSVGRLLK